MSADLYLALDAQFAKIERIFLWLNLFGQPVACPTNEVGGKQRHLFLQKNCRFRAHLDAMQVKDLLAFFDARLNGLSLVVMLEPGR